LGALVGDPAAGALHPREPAFDLKRVMNPFPWRRFGILLGIFAWSLAVIAGYYLVHKPVSPVQAQAALAAAIDVLAAFALAGLAGGIGRRLLPEFPLDSLERAALQAGLGWGALSLAWWGAGLLRLYQPWIGWLALAAGWVLFRRPIRLWLADLGEARAAWREASAFGRLIAGLCAALIAAQLLFALAPPLKWDSLAYHLALPRQYLHSGRFLLLPENPLWGRSQLAEILYTWSMALRGLETAAVSGWWFSAMLLAGVMGTVRRLAAHGDAAWVAAAALLAGATLRGMFSWAYVDGIAGLYGWAVFALCSLGITGARRDWAPWAGVFCGLALGVKFTSGLLLPVVLVSLWAWRKSLASPWQQQAVILTGIALLFFSPWMVKNWLATGNPLYPHLWPTAWTSAERLVYYQGSSSLESLGWEDAVLPLTATWFGMEAAFVQGFQKYYADLGPLLVLLAVPGLWVFRRQTPARLAGLWLALGWAAMVAGGVISDLLWQTRYFYTLLPPAALAAGYGWQAVHDFSAGGVRLGRILSVLIILVMLLSVWQDGIQAARLNPGGVALGVRSRQDYLQDGLGPYAAAMAGLAALPADSRTLILWDERSLYAPFTAQADPLIDRWLVDRRVFGAPQAILKAWRQQGFTHLLVHGKGARFEFEHSRGLTLADRLALESLLAWLPAPVDYAQTYQLYTLGSP
jgi:hypothetical protein